MREGLALYRESKITSFMQNNINTYFLYALKCEFNSMKAWHSLKQLCDMFTNMTNSFQFPWESFADKWFSTNGTSKHFMTASYSRIIAHSSLHLTKHIILNYWIDPELKKELDGFGGRKWGKRRFCNVKEKKSA